MKPVIGYTLGDQSGIGPEVIFAALASGELPEDAEYRLIGKKVELPPGRPNAESAKHAFDHLEQAAHALREGTVDAVVTAPVCKETLHEAGFRWPGQTEFFAERLETDNYAMCLTGKRLTVGLATIHHRLRISRSGSPQRPATWARQTCSARKSHECCRRKCPLQCTWAKSR